MTSRRVCPFLLGCVLVASGCSHADGPGSGAGTAASTKGSANVDASSAAGTAPSHRAEQEIDPRFVADVKQAFSEYKAWGRVDDELRWAPFLCRMPMPGRPKMSKAEGEGGHAKKLYSLLARDRAAYVSLGSELSRSEGGTNRAKGGVPQIVAKESYLPELVANPGPNAPFPAQPSEDGDHFVPYSKEEDGKTYRASKLVGVYFVIEKPGDVEGTDDGFIYGTVTPSGEVTSAGRVASCMSCHVEAPHRRFFGSPGLR